MVDTTMGSSVSEVTLNMMRKRVLRMKPDGKQEMPIDAYIRVAKHVSFGPDGESGHKRHGSTEQAQKFMDKAVQMMAEGRFMPNTPTLSNAGFPNAQLSACFVLPVHDRLSSIHLAQKHQGLIQASGGGTGFYLGHIRAEGTPADSGKVVTRGPINWLQMYNENATHVAQGMREGANMAILGVGHSDIVKFITCKKAGRGLREDELAKTLNLSLPEARRLKAIIGIERFNLSVSVPDMFMQALEAGDEWNLIDPHTKQKTSTMPAQELWNMIITNAHEYGDPGLFFVDEVNRHNPLPHLGPIETTNPCGEQELHPYESCTLGHVNLSKYVVGTNGSSRVDWAGLEDAIRFGVQFLDNVVDVNVFPIQEIAEMNLRTRRIGLGVMGWADMLAYMSIPYDSDEALKLADNVGALLDNASFDESQKLGRDRGSFLDFEQSIYAGKCTHLRHSNRTTVAPTGQSSMYAGCSSGIEPLFAPVIVRNQAEMLQVDYHPALFNILSKRGLDTPDIRSKFSGLHSVREANFLPDDIKQSFPSAHDITPQWHVKHQITWQKYVTSAISKTVNLPNHATVADVDEVYKMAWRGGCKGITVYRDGSRSGQPLSTTSKPAPIPEIHDLVTIGGHRSEVTKGTNRKIPNGCGNLMVYVGEGDNGRIEEITARLGKGGGCAAAQTEAIARMASVAMQNGVPPEKIIKQLGGIRCHLSAFHKGLDGSTRNITSCGDAISVALAEHVASKTNGVKYQATDTHAGACPDCGGQLAHEEGCVTCHGCGFSRCS